MATPDVLTVTSLNCCYPNVPVLDNISFSVREGEMVCLLGASGEGKTTLLKSIAGLLAFEQGRITIANQNVGDPAGGGSRAQFGRYDFSGRRAVSPPDCDGKYYVWSAR